MLLIVIRARGMIIVPMEQHTAMETANGEIIIGIPFGWVTVSLNE